MQVAVQQNAAASDTRRISAIAADLHGNRTLQQMSCTNKVTSHMNQNMACRLISLPSWLIHDLLQPLHVYGLANEQLKAFLSEKLADDKSASESWQMLDTSIRSQERLLTKLRQYWHINFDDSEININPISLNGLLKLFDSTDFVKPDGIQICLNNYDEIHVSSNEKLLNELITCIFENAIYYANSKVEISITNNDDNVSINISDDGPGIETDILESIGIPFIRSNHQNKFKKGLGLGLYIAMQNANKLDHRIHFTNNREGGFSVTLTMKEAKQFETSALLNSKNILEGLGIRIIDNDADFSTRLTRQLKEWGCFTYEEDSNCLTEKTSPIDNGYYIVMISGENFVKFHKTLVKAISENVLTYDNLIIITNNTDNIYNRNVEAISFSNIKILKRPLTPTRLKSALLHKVCALRNKFSK